MTLYYTLFALAVMAFAPSPAAPTGMCNRTVLVDCFVESIDEFSQVLWSSRTNVVGISDDDCVHVRKMGDCLEDQGPKQHGCTRMEVMATSRTLSELMLHRQRVGTFMKSYHLLAYACSPEGRPTINQHRDCLMQESIGQATLSATTYLSEKYFEDQDRTDICVILQRKMVEYKTSLRSLCNNAAAPVMCESVTRAITGTYPQQTAGCYIDCKDMEEQVDPTPYDDIKHLPQQQNGVETRDGKSGAQHVTAAVFTTIVVAFGVL